MQTNERSRGTGPRATVKRQGMGEDYTLKDRLNRLNRLIVALDTDDIEKIERISKAVIEMKVAWVKIGFQAFTAVGSEGFESLCQNRHRIFLDLKFHDIPNTVARDVGTMTKRGAHMINMHAAGGIEMMQAAKASADAASSQKSRPILLGVTMLTSIDEPGFQTTFGSERKITEQVVHLARQTRKAGLDGVVASPLEIEAIREACGDDFVIVTPGIRPKWAATGDQRRFTTPAEAINRGADYIVVGRPVLEAEDPREAIEKILEEMV